MVCIIEPSQLYGNNTSWYALSYLGLDVELKVSFQVDQNLECCYVFNPAQWLKLTQWSLVLNPIELTPGSSSHFSYRGETTLGCRDFGGRGRFSGDLN